MPTEAQYRKQVLLGIPFHLNNDMVPVQVGDEEVRLSVELFWSKRRA